MSVYENCPADDYQWDKKYVFVSSMWQKCFANGKVCPRSAVLLPKASVTREPVRKYSWKLLWEVILTQLRAVQPLASPKLYRVGNTQLFLLTVKKKTRVNIQTDEYIINSHE